MPPDEPIRSPVLGVDGYILEGLVTTHSADGSVNISPMGPLVAASLDRLWLRPFNTSTTFQNLQHTRRGVFHITDDVELIAQAAVGQPKEPPRMLERAGHHGLVLADACRWYAFELDGFDEEAERPTIAATVVDRGALREFAGFNRAKHAVLEAAILATRVHLLELQEIEADFERLGTIVRKTGAAAEHRAFELLVNYIGRTIGAARRRQ